MSGIATFRKYSILYLMSCRLQANRHIINCADFLFNKMRRCNLNFIYLDSHIIVGNQSSKKIKGRYVSSILTRIAVLAGNIICS